MRVCMYVYMRWDLRCKPSDREIRRVRYASVRRRAATHEPNSDDGRPNHTQQQRRQGRSEGTTYTTTDGRPDDDRQLGSPQASTR